MVYSLEVSKNPQMDREEVGGKQHDKQEAKKELEVPKGAKLR